MSNQLNGVQEGLFTKKKTVDELLSTAQKKISKMKSPSEVSAKLKDVNTVGKQINTALRSMSIAAKKCASGKISEKDFKVSVSEASKSIASPVKTLYASLGNIVEDKKSVTSDEIKAFQAYLSGLKRLLNEQKKKIGSSGSATESFTNEEGFSMKNLTVMESSGDPELDEVLESCEEMLEEGCTSKKKKKCASESKCSESKCTESDDEDDLDEIDIDDDECDDDECEDEDDDNEDKDEDEDDDDDDDEEDDEDDTEESCSESLNADILDEYSSSCESMMNYDFDGATPLLNADGTLRI